MEFVIRIPQDGGRRFRARSQENSLQEERLFWLAWSQIPGIGSVLLGRLQYKFGNLQTAWTASPNELATVEGIGPQVLEAICSQRLHTQLQDLWRQHQQKNPTFWTPADLAYPRLLLEIPSFPTILYYRGQVEPLESQSNPPTVAIVGTRAPSDYGKKWTRILTEALVRHGFTIVSGLAEGIDTEAHWSCLEAGGRTIAVLGTGVDVVYPWQNRKLYQQVIQHGLAVSEYSAGTKPDRLHFPQRNRIIAGLSRAVIVIEAPYKSGALITAHLANDYGRDVYALPGSLDNPQSVGCLGLLNKGAHVILGVDSLLELLGSLPNLDPIPLPQSTQLSLPDLDPDLQQVLKHVSAEPILLDAIVQRSGIPAPIVSSTLLQLELDGWVTQLPGMRYVRGSGG
ncbi:MAG: DNA-processing protein DprA [Leptolyngbyaceae cyanobacterium bins.59]|nr:DNA-processing protein DprA [Leptolyngbyaceae cyanobacterium bins.59]